MLAILSGSSPRSMAAMRSRWSISNERWRCIMRTMPAVMPPTMATMGMLKAISGIRASGLKSNMVGLRRRSGWVASVRTPQLTGAAPARVAPRLCAEDCCGAGFGAIQAARRLRPKDLRRSTRPATIYGAQPLGCPDATRTAAGPVQSRDGPPARTPSGGRADGGRAKAHRAGAIGRPGGVPGARRAAPGARLHALAAHPALGAGRRGGGAGRIRARVDGAPGLPGRVELCDVAVPDRGAAGVRPAAGDEESPRARARGGQATGARRPRGGGRRFAAGGVAATPDRRSHAGAAHGGDAVLLRGAVGGAGGGGAGHPGEHDEDAPAARARRAARRVDARDGGRAVNCLEFERWLDAGEPDLL